MMREPVVRDEPHCNGTMCQWEPQCDCDCHACTRATSTHAQPVAVAATPRTLRVSYAVDSENDALRVVEELMGGVLASCGLDYADGASTQSEGATIYDQGARISVEYRRDMSRFVVSASCPWEMDYPDASWWFSPPCIESSETYDPETQRELKGEAFFWGLER